MTIPNGPSKTGTPPVVVTDKDFAQHPIPLAHSDSSVYTRLLLPKGHGYPLWIPETDTDLPPEYRRYGIRIGDVGVVTDDGGFDYLFNICLPANDPVNKGRVPRDFKPLDASLDIRNNPTRFKPGADISSSYIKKTKKGDTQETSTYVFTPSCDEGAILVLPEGGARSDLKNHGEFRRFAAQHAAAWYQFINNELGWEITNGTLYLVTGVDKTSSWGNAAFSNAPHAVDVSMEFGPKSASQPSKGYVWTKDGSASVRYGPDLHEDSERSSNQSIFIRGFRVCVSATLYNNSLRKSNGEEAVNTSSTRILRRPQAYHPSTIINEFIFKKTTGVDIILVNDEQWPALLNENDTILPENEELIRRTFNKYNLIINKGVAHLELNNNTKTEEADQSLLKPKLNITTSPTKHEPNGASNYHVKPTSKSMVSPRSSSLGMSAAELLRLQQIAPIPSPTSYRQMASNDLVAKSPLRSRAVNTSSPLVLSPTVRFAETYGGNSTDSSVTSSPQLDSRARIISPSNVLPNSAVQGVAPGGVPAMVNGNMEGQEEFGQQDLGTSLVMAHHRLQPQYLGPYYIVSPQMDGGFQSPATSSSVASQDTRYSNNRNPGLYKTELCRSWEEKGWCRYGGKCQFAHGQDDLRSAVRHPKYKTEICRTFWATGSCPYGNRCCFVHTDLPGQPGVIIDGNKANAAAVNANASTNVNNNISNNDGELHLSRIAVRTQDLQGSVDSPSSAGANSSGVGTRQSLRIDTTSLDGPSVQNKSAFPSFARNRDNLPVSSMMKSPAAVTAGVVWDDPSRRVVR